MSRHDKKVITALLNDGTTHGGHMIWTRNEYISHLTFEYTGREMFTELFGLLVGLDGEWKAQGAAADELDLTAFGWDYVKYAHAACDLQAVTGFPPRVLEDNAEYTISIDSMGRKQKLCKQSATIPLPMDYPVKTFDDWLKIKHWYAFDESRVDRDALLCQKKLQEEGVLIIASIPGGFDEPRQLMGDEELCVAFYDQPELVHDMLSTFLNTALQVFERVTDILSVDNLCVHEDMAGKSGPLAGPKQIREFIAPYYARIYKELARKGARLFSQDSDGNMNAAIDAFLDAGVNVMYPLEPAAGMDIVELRAKYGKRLAFKGGLDKFALRGTKEDIQKELTYKICPTTIGGGTVFAIDHRIPNGVPIENYRYYADLGRELLGLPAREKRESVRMAF